jgi:hypothetical protein
MITNSSGIWKKPEVGVASPKMYFAKGYEFHKIGIRRTKKAHWYAGGIIDRIMSIHHIGVWMK